MALRRLHWRNSLLGEVLYLVNVAKVSVLMLFVVCVCGGCVLGASWLLTVVVVGRGAAASSLTLRPPLCSNTHTHTHKTKQTGRVHLLPPVKRPPQRPTFFFLF